MAKTKISEFSTTAGNNTDINSINIAEGCAPSGINDAIRELMRQLKEFQTGGAGDSVNSGGDFSVATNKFTVASATGNTSVAGTLGATGDFSVNTDKFTVTASSGNTSVAGTLASTGNFAVNTDKFTVAASTGNTAVGGTFAVTGATTLTGALVANGNSTLGDADTDTVTLNASFVNGTTLKTAKTATNTLALAAYDVDGTAYTNLVTLTAGNTPSLALTSTAVGTINNMSIGATTASTGAFTTVSASGNVTLSGGTANGVAYLNGSKVVTTGTALTFDGTNLGVGISSPFYKLTVQGSADAQNILHIANSVGSADGDTTNVVRVTANGNSVWANARWSAYSHQWYNNGSEQMRLTSTGLGIGTSSPAAKLDVLSTGVQPAILRSSNATGGYLALYDSANSAYRGFIGWGAGTITGAAITDLCLAPGTSGAIRFGDPNGNATYAMINSSGNLGLGVTPSAWSTGKALELGVVGNAIWSPGSTFITNNTYYNGGYKYANTAAASYYQQNVGIHYWFTAPSGTAGTAATFTQAMTLDASGRLMVGGTTALGSAATFYGTQASVVISQSSTTSYAGLRIYNDQASGARALEIDYAGSAYSGALITGGPTGESAAIATTGAYPLALGTNNTARVTIDSSGNLIQSAPSTAPTLSTNGTMVFNLTSNTNLRVSVRGSDGVTRTANITLA